MAAKMILSLSGLNENSIVAIYLFVALLCFSLIITALFDSVVIVQNHRYMFLKYNILCV